MFTAARTVSVLVGTGLLAACASLNTLQADVASYGNWPVERKPGTYTFERLPSQEARADVQQRLEDAAHPALQAAGFTAAKVPRGQLMRGLSVSASSPSPPPHWRCR